MKPIADVRPWPRYMSARVAATYSDTSPWTVRRNVRPCGRRGRSFVYAIEDVERWMRGEPVVVPAGDTDGRRRQAPTPASESIARIRSLARSRSSSAADVAEGEDDMAA